MKMDFDWRLIKSFLTVLDTGSLMGAARLTGAQQPTLGRHISELELQLGAPLFERTGRGLIPTAAALDIAEAARHMQSGADALSRRVTGCHQATTGTVRITASEVVACYLLPRLLTRLRQQEPGIQVELVASNRIDNLLRREADIAVRMARPQRQQSLLARKLADVPVVMAAHESYLARAGTPLHSSDLLQHSLIGYDQDDTILRGFAKQGIPIPREAFGLRTDNHLAYGQLLAAGAGIGFVAAYNLRHWPGTQVVLPELEIPSLPCWLVVHREIRSNAVIRKVYDHLAQAITEELQS
ncbi:LysR family transcriptional regulator [Roseateles sp. BYS180W]|uniref:LysR family transcriptional regulator n=1 Tax=Roseateles rivi TaxID=3299028 RepID=A0ABW7FVG0_9BURK